MPQTLKEASAIAVVAVLLVGAVLFYIADWDRTATTANTLAALSVVAGLGFYLLGWTPRSSVRRRGPSG